MIDHDVVAGAYGERVVGVIDRIRAVAKSHVANDGIVGDICVLPAQHRTRAGDTDTIAGRGLASNRKVRSADFQWAE